MFIDRLLNQGSTPLLEQTLQFTTARHRLIAEDVVNASTPGYRQRDLSLPKFQKMLAERSRQADESSPGSVSFGDVTSEIENRHHGILFHDGQSRSMEELMSDQAKNAMMHNLAIELLRHQFQQIQMALKGQP
jgi:flagellar basal-body rod protein FlgB